MNKENKYKIVVIGDGAIGKTSLLITYVKGKFPKRYSPTIFENYTKQVKYKGTTYNLELVDTGGQEDYDSIRALSYPDTDAFIVCYSIASPISFQNIRTKWVSDMKDNDMKDTPFLLLGLKKDLKEDEKTIEELAKTKKTLVPLEKANELASSIGAFDVYECSAKEDDGVDQAFIKVIKKLNDDFLIKKKNKGFLKKVKNIFSKSIFESSKKDDDDEEPLMSLS